jgi:hypothetical protein
MSQTAGEMEMAAAAAATGGSQYQSCVAEAHLKHEQVRLYSAVTQGSMHGAAYQVTTCCGA